MSGVKVAIQPVELFLAYLAGVIIALANVLAKEFIKGRCFYAKHFCAASIIEDAHKPGWP